ncbi:MAG: hypothetical protein H6719_07910 [Sandaracinaceae bacterium]|nr:hypothetical protein [Sandaracinaceae bacterium]
MKGKRAVAAAVTSVGVLAIWAMATVRQEDQTRELGRQWVGEQWDIARRCVVGTPIGRRDAEEAVADRLAANAVDTLASVAFEDEAPDPARLWPARCAPLLSGLNVDPSVTGGTDLSRPVAELEALARHALTLDDPAQTLLRARELAGPIHVLDGAMPPGAEYDPTHFDPPRADAGAFEASLRCQEPAGAPEAAPCAAEDGDPGGGSPRPAGEPRLEACDGERSVALWPEGRRWTGTRCEGTSCAPLPPLEGGEPVDVGLRGDGVVVVTRGRWTPLRFARGLADGGWSAPVPVPMGRLEPGGEAITACGDRWTFDVR